MQPAHHQVVKPGRRIPRKSLRLNIYTTDGLVAHPKPFAPVSFVWLAVFVLTLNLSRVNVFEWWTEANLLLSLCG